MMTRSMTRRIAELEKENEKLKEEKSVLMAVAAGNYKRGDEFKAICREYFTAEYIDSCVRAMDAALVSEYFRDTEDEDSEDEDENEDYECEECGVQVIAADIPENECRSIAYGSLSMAFCKPCYERSWAEHPENPANASKDESDDDEN